ncbi:MAG: L-seryl-tRNA(Sec) selenium transferase [Wolinella sp.]
MNSLRSLPQMDKLLQMPRFKDFSKEPLREIAREYLDELREAFLQQHTPIPSEESLAQELERRYHALFSPSLIPLINATGVIIHTNLGRSPFSEAILEEIKPVLTSYNNLEYCLEKGERGERYSHLQEILRRLLSCEDVLVVNNNAAAVFLILHTFAKEREVLISRGELIEIGGSFRIPEVMKNAGAILKEVGTTNKTYKHDYTEAITPMSALIMKAHKSNYNITGFTREVELEELIGIAREHGLIDYYDLGSGFLDSIPFSREPTIKAIAKLSPSLVSFSGDKLLGGAQAGIIFGKKVLIEQLKQNHLLRMLRVDKFTLSALEATLRAHLVQDYEKIPTIQMMLLDTEELRARAEGIVAKLRGYEREIITTKGFVGGGALPNQSFDSIAIALKHPKLKSVELEKRVRARHIIARIERDSLVFDLRTVLENQLKELAARLNEIF